MVKKLSTAAVIAALYAALTLLISPIAYGPLQIRLSEVLCIFAVFTPAAIPGLTLGCFLANILGPNGIIDAVIGSCATLIGSALIYLLRKHPQLGLVCNSAVNGVIIGLELVLYFGEALPLGLCMLYIFIGELISCCGLGYPAYKLINKHKSIFNL